MRGHGWQRPHLLLLAVLLTVGTPAALAEESPDPFADLRFRHVGPLGNRVSAVAGVPGDPRIYYVGAASGGVFKTEDGGASWRPIFDDQPVASIGSIAVAPSDSNVVWVGTGEAFIRSNVSMGNGIYRSTDGGRTWQHRGLPESARIGRILVHPRDPNVVYAAVLGHCYGPQDERGVYRTRDGGETWERVLFVDPDTGISDLAMNPANPRILFAGSWQMRIWTWGRESGGPGSGLWVSRDGGDSWSRLSGNGLPKSPWGKVGLATTPADPDRVYALIETSTNRDFAPVEQHQGVLWGSDDGGESWNWISSDHRLVQRPLYYSRAVAAPDDRDEVHFLSVRHRRSLDGGRTTLGIGSGGDFHDLWIDPLAPDRMISGHDQGISISLNRGESWLRPQLPIAQMYHVATDDRIPYFLYGNRQDGPSTHGPSNSLTRGGIPIGAWRSVGGCETGFAVPQPDGEVVWTGCFDGILARHEVATGLSRDVSVWPDAIEAWAAEDMKFRFQWTFPIALSPHDPGRVYVGSQYVHVSEDAGQSWQVISPDLTTDDPDLQRRRGGLTLDDSGPTVAPTVFALAESPLVEGLIWAGTNDGKVQHTRDGGATWKDLTAGLPGLPERATISNIEPSPHDPAVATLTVDGHQLGDFDPYVYRTTNYGESWRRIDGDLPRGPLAYTHCVREDPRREGLLYVGTESALHVSFDSGRNWRRLAAGLPPAPVHWIEVQERFSDLVVATYGRGFWILDDISPLRSLDDRGNVAETGLLPPRDAYRFRNREAPMRQPGDPAAGEDPPYGASLNYAAATDLADAPEIEILDDDGAVLARLEGLSREAGLHRVWWDLTLEGSATATLRTPPDEHAHVAMSEDGTRDMEEGWSFAPKVVPGVYRVRLKAGDQSFEQSLAVLVDPDSTATAEALEAQLETLLELRGLLDRSVAVIDSIESLREQLSDLDRRLGAHEEAAEVAEEARRLERRLAEVEGELFDLRLTGAGQDTLRWSRRLYARLLHLAVRVDSSDHPPTDAALALLAEHRAAVEDVEERLSELRTGDLAALNETLGSRGLGGVITP